MNKTFTAISLSVALSGVLTATSFAQPEPAAEQPAETETAAPTVLDPQLLRDQRVTPPSLNRSEAIAKVQEANLMRGDKDGKFHGERALSRAELASILVKAFNLDKRQATHPETEVLKDVPSTYWASDDIHTVLRLGIMKGYRNNLFYPEQRISRAEALAIFAQAYGVQQYDDATVKTILSTYPDSASIPDWAKKAMATTLKNGFLDVPPAGQIRPQQPMTRGDMAFALGQYLNRLHESEQPNLH